jgi:hypothetical protein
MRKRARLDFVRGLQAPCVAVALGAAITLLPERADAADDLVYYPTRTTYGDVGLLEMPSARMAPDGELSATIGAVDGAQRYNFAFQLLPWLEGSFRYSHIQHIEGIANEYDRSFGLKVRLLRENDVLPDVSLGIRDILGTGIYAAEYIVASKRFGDFDVTTGLGWGRLASVDAFPNPFAAIFPSFEKRTANNSQTGGSVNFGEFFHGPSMGVFGGVVWRSPIENLDVLAEYSSDKYVIEQAGGSIKVRIPVNVGLAYKAFNAITMSAGWYYGSSYGIALSFDTDPTVPVSPERLGPDIPAPVIRPISQQVDALSQLLARDQPASVLPARPFVQLPATRPDPDAMMLEAALMSEATGVHTVDLMGRTVVIDAHLTQTASRQCDGYAQIIATLAPRLQTVALSDLDSPSGQVAVCAIPRLVNDAPDAGDDADAGPPDPGPIVDPALASRKIAQDIAAQELKIEAMKLEPTMAWVYFSNAHYGRDTEAVGRIARILMADAPPSIEVFHIVSVRSGVQLRDYTVARSALERVTLAYGTAHELPEAVSTAPAPLSNPVLERAQSDEYPRLHWSIGPGLRTGFFDPDVPLQIQVLAAINASIDITPNLTVEGRVEGNIYNNYDVNRNSNSALPHVRSDLNLYFKHGINGIANLDSVYRTRLSRDVYFEAKAGYLEDMFAGGGGQFLWRPEGSRISFGADVYEVWQRNFDRLFGLQNYHVLTGHASVYYQSPWYGLNFAVHAGRYLAGDYGATFEMTRRFDTGVEIGAFATFTNVPFAKFGEGSFDKGIIIHIPLEWALPFYSQGSYDMRLRSLIRDGGQRLDNDDSLFEETRPDSYGEVIGHIDDVVAP